MLMFVQTLTSFKGEIPGEDRWTFQPYDNDDISCAVYCGETFVSNYYRVVCTCEYTMKTLIHKLSPPITAANIHLVFV
jgi:hypothetical protein